MTRASTYLGVFSPVTSTGNELRDGSAVACRTGGRLRSAAATEERLSGRRYDPGIAKSVGRVLADVGHCPADRLVVGISSALAPPLDPGQASEVLRCFTGLVGDEVRVIGHHRAHALAAFGPSGFDEAIVFVIDSMGDVVAEAGQRTVECQSVFIARRTSDGAISLDLDVRDFPDGNGYGQLYRAVTLFLGFPGYHHASKVMAIAGSSHADASALPLPHRWGPDGPEFLVDIDPEAPVASLDLWLRQHLSARTYEGPRAAGWFDPARFRENGIASLRPQDLLVAAWVQNALEQFMAERVRSAVSRLGIHRVCLGGGTSLNCVANALVRELPEVEDVYVGCAPGDSGQALGNLIALLSDDDPGSIAALREPYLSTPARIGTLCEHSLKAAVRVLEEGGVVAVGRGEPEYGPRALGHRSLLALPTAANVQRLRDIKEREDYQPFAAVVTNDYADTTLGGLRSPYMSFAPRITGQAADDLRYVRHLDGTCRIQTVSPGQDPWLHAVLIGLAEHGLPAVSINTSLNVRGAAMAHDLEDPASLAATYRADLAIVETSECGDRTLMCTAAPKVEVLSGGQ